MVRLPVLLHILPKNRETSECRQRRHTRRRQYRPFGSRQIRCAYNGIKHVGRRRTRRRWYDFIAGVEVLDLKGKKVALFGCGDESMTDTFCNAVGELHDRLEPTGCIFIAPYDTIGYTFEKSKAKPGDALEAYGLLLDEVNHPELTAPRLAGWTTIVRESAS